MLLPVTETWSNRDRLSSSKRTMGTKKRLDPVTSLLGIYSKEIIKGTHKDLSTRTHIVFAIYPGKKPEIP